MGCDRRYGCKLSLTQTRPINIYMCGLLKFYSTDCIRIDMTNSYEFVQNY